MLNVKKNYIQSEIVFSVGYEFRNWKVVEECKSVCDIGSGVCGGRLSVILGVVCVVGEREVELCSIGWPWEGESMVIGVRQ